jgi:hypothetical protein
MMVSTCATVEFFFQAANWQGLKIIHDDKDVIVKEVTKNLHFGLTVESFFSLHNWQGILKTHQGVTVNHEELSSEINQPSYPLTMSVGEFFQRMVWQGQNKYESKKVNIASMTKMSDVVTFTPQSLNVKDLSDLF